MDDDYSCKPFGYEQIQYHVESALGMDSPKNLQVLGAHWQTIRFKYKYNILKYTHIIVQTDPCYLFASFWIPPFLLSYHYVKQKLNRNPKQNLRPFSSNQEQQTTKHGETFGPPSDFVASRALPQHRGKTRGKALESKRRHTTGRWWYFSAWHTCFSLLMEKSLRTVRVFFSPTHRKTNNFPFKGGLLMKVNNCFGSLSEVPMVWRFSCAFFYQVSTGIIPPLSKMDTK